MAAEAGADTIVTACPFCMANMRTRSRSRAWKERWRQWTLAELVDRQME
jgi:Fe-S oxidoreductase